MSPRLTVITLGEFRVLGPAGADLTPRAQKACGLIALLCDAPGLRRPRAAVQDKLWSDREPAQGAASLRQVLTEIRKSFGEYRDTLYSDKRVVGLDPEAVAVDLHDPEARADAARRGIEFLEGLNLRDPEFEDWLRDRRLALADAVGAAAEPKPAPPAPTTKRGLKARTPMLYVSVVDGNDDTMFADYIVNAIAKGTSDVGAVEVRTFDASHLADPEMQAFVLEGRERRIGDGTAVRLQLRATPSGRISWQEASILTPADLQDAGNTLARLINQGIERTSATFAGCQSSGVPGDKPPGLETLVSGTAGLLRRMWNSAARNPSELMAGLQAAFDRDGRGIHLAWQALVWCFIVGERRGNPDTQSDAERLIRRALELEPHSPVVLAIASHVFGFLLKRFEVALELAERSVQVDRNNVLGWTFLGIARMNMGDKAGAYTAASVARRIAGEGPHRSFVDSVATSISSLTGHAEEAIALGETAHVFRPDFAATLRYLLATYIAIGDLERARITAARLREIEPDFEVSLLAEPEYPVEPIRRSGIIEMDRLPKLGL